MADAPPPTLAAFAAVTPDNRPRCLLCNVDPDIERQVREGKQAGVTYRVIGKWLDTVLDSAITQGKPVTKGRLERHFQQGHTR